MKHYHSPPCGDEFAERGFHPRRNRHFYLTNGGLWPSRTRQAEPAASMSILSERVTNGVQRFYLTNGGLWPSRTRQAEPAASESIILKRAANIVPRLSFTSALLASFLFIASASFAVTITQAEYFLNTDPGQGLATPITITPGENISITGLIVPPTGLLPDRVHKLNLRFRSDEGFWSFADARYFFILQGGAPFVDTVRVVQAEYWFNALPATLVDIPDGETSAYAALIPTTGLTTDRLHTFSTRYLDDNGNWSAPATRYFYILLGGGGTVQYRVVTDLEYWIDSNPPTPLDLTDAATVSFNSLIPSVGLSSGLHRFNIRYRDDTGAWSMAEARNFVIISQTAPAGPPSFLTAAEYYINSNPAPGSGISIPLPQDGLWNEHDEETAVVITNLPVGLHLFCLRYRDEQGTWSSAFCDSVIMSPVLVIRASGPNVVLTWQADTSHIPFTIYRADAFAGPYVQIAQTNVPSYTDPVALPDLRKYYRVTTTTTALSSYRRPEQTTLLPRE